MAVKTYRYRWPTGADIATALGAWIGPPPVVAGSDIYASTVDLDYEEANKGQLDDAMVQLGWIYDSEIV